MSAIVGFAAVDGWCVAILELETSLSGAGPPAPFVRAGSTPPSSGQARELQPRIARDETAKVLITHSTHGAH